MSMDSNSGKSIDPKKLASTLQTFHLTEDMIGDCKEIGDEKYEATLSDGGTLEVKPYDNNDLDLVPHQRGYKFIYKVRAPHCLRAGFIHVENTDALYKYIRRKALHSGTKSSANRGK